MHNYLNKVTQGDCLELMKNIPEKSIDMILCDLPYGTTHCKWDSIIDLDLMWNEYNRIIKDDGAIVLFSAQPFTTKLINSNIKNYKYTWYWDKKNKGNFLNAKRQPLRQIEEISVFNKHKYFPQGLKDYGVKRNRGSKSETTMQNYKNEWTQEKTGYPSNLLEFSIERKGLHPTQKPIALLEYLLKTYTEEGEVVLDNCIGSGSTGIACINTKRKFIGFEKEEEYVNIANDRINKRIEEVSNG